MATRCVSALGAHVDHVGVAVFVEMGEWLNHVDLVRLRGALLIAQFAPQAQPEFEQVTKGAEDHFKICAGGRTGHARQMRDRHIRHPVTARFQFG